MEAQDFQGLAHVVQARAWPVGGWPLSEPGACWDTTMLPEAPEASRRLMPGTHSAHVGWALWAQKTLTNNDVQFFQEKIFQISLSLSLHLSHLFPPEPLRGENRKMLSFLGD